MTTVGAIYSGRPSLPLIHIRCSEVVTETQWGLIEADSLARPSI